MMNIRKLFGLQDFSAFGFIFIWFFQRTLIVSGLSLAVGVAAIIVEYGLRLLGFISTTGILYGVIGVLIAIAGVALATITVLVLWLWAIAENQ